MARNNTLRNSLPGLGLVIASMIPAALNSAPSTQPGSGVRGTAVASTERERGGQEFTISLRNLRDWAAAVEITLFGIHVEGNSDVHPLDHDCEIHFGGHASSFQGVPDGLVLEPMNACVQPFPGQTVQKDSDWKSFADGLKGLTVSASGVPRIWPEHLNGKESVSNPHHAVELHPLTSLVSAGRTFDFAEGIFAPEKFSAEIQPDSASAIIRKTSVTVARNGDFAEINFRGKTGNFAVIEFVIDRSSITSDGAGSFRMNGEVEIDGSTAIPIRIVTVKGSPINDDIGKMKTRRHLQIGMTALVLFSLSPESLLDAANQSNGNDVTAERPIQLILFGPPSSE
jgi:hypothetical protein